MGDTLSVTNTSIPAETLEKVVIGGDLSKLTPTERLAYYRNLCDSLGLNPLTKPFEYLVLNDRLLLYARRDATDQLRRRYGVSIRIVSREVVDGVYIVTAQATTADGRTDEAIGAVPLMRPGGQWKTDPRSGKRYFDADGSLIPLSPDDRANAIMKAETKAKRRVTLSICGLGMLDESELETVPTAKPVVDDREAARHANAAQLAALKASAAHPSPPLPPAATVEATEPPRAEVSATEEDHTTQDSQVQADGEEAEEPVVVPDECFVADPASEPEPATTTGPDAETLFREALERSAGDRKALNGLWQEIVRSSALTSEARARLYRVYAAGLKPVRRGGQP